MRSESERKCAVVEWAGELQKEGEKEGDETNGSIHIHIYICVYIQSGLYGMHTWVNKDSGILRHDASRGFLQMMLKEQL